MWLSDKMLCRAVSGPPGTHFIGGLDGECPESILPWNGEFPSLKWHMQN